MSIFKKYNTHLIADIDIKNVSMHEKGPLYIFEKREKEKKKGRTSKRFVYIDVLATIESVLYK